MSRADLAAAATEPLRLLDQDLSTASPEVGQILRLIRDGVFSQDFRIDDIELALAGQAEAQLDQFAAEIGRPAELYLTHIRIETGAALLTDTDLSIRRISSLVGYEDDSVFHKSFERITRYKPGEFRRLSAAARASSESAPEQHVFLTPFGRSRLGHRLSESLFGLIAMMAHEASREFLRVGAVQFGSCELFELLSSKARAGGASTPECVELAELALDSVEGSAGVLGPRYSKLQSLADRQLDETRVSAAAGESRAAAREPGGWRRR